MRGPGCAAGEPSPSGGGGQRLDELVSEADDLIGPHVAADHAVGQARLKRLIDDASVGGKIGRAARHELRKRHFLGHASPLRMQNAHYTRPARRLGNKFDLPNSLAAIAPVLLEDPRAGRLEPWRERGAEVGRRTVEVGIGAPSKMLGA